MKILITIFLLISPHLVFALTIENPDGVFHECTEEYNFIKSPQVELLKNIPEGTIVCRASLGSELPDTKKFSDVMRGVTFVEGNLDNVFIPIGNTVIGITPKKFKVQNDLRDWTIDSQGMPLNVLNEEVWVEKGVSVDPREIPDKKVFLKPGEDLIDILKVRMGK